MNDSFGAAVSKPVYLHEHRKGVFAKTGQTVCFGCPIGPLACSQTRRKE